MLRQRAIIIAGGKGKRWNNYLGVKKHFIKIKNETLIERQARLLKENRIKDIHLVNNDFKIKGVKNYKARSSPYEIDKIYGYKDIWKKEMIILYGDVFFTEEAMKKIVNLKVKDILFFGREKGSEITGCNYGEIFALKTKNIKLLERGCNFIRKLYISGRIKRCKTWELYRWIEGIPLKEHRVNGRFIEINDFTEDFDYPEDYDRWIKNYEKSKLS